MTESVDGYDKLNTNIYSDLNKFELPFDDLCLTYGIYKRALKLKKDSQGKTILEETFYKQKDSEDVIKRRNLQKFKTLDCVRNDFIVNTMTRIKASSEGISQIEPEEETVSSVPTNQTAPVGQSVAFSSLSSKPLFTFDNAGKGQYLHPYSIRITNVPSSTTENDIKGFLKLSQVSDNVRVRMCKNYSQIFTGSVIVSFKEKNEGDVAIKLLNQMLYGDRVLGCSWSDNSNRRRT